MNRLISLLIILFFAEILFSQNSSFINYSVNEDLQSATVYQSLQDSKGYLWFATDNGVSRFNGYEFENFTTLDGLLSNTVFNIYEDYKGRIWFVSFNGNLCYYFNNNIHKYKYNNILSYEKNGILTPPKNNFYVDSTENIYISFNENSVFFKVDSIGNFEKYNSKEDFMTIKILNEKISISTNRINFKKVILEKNNILKKYYIENNEYSVGVTNSQINNNEVIFNTNKTIYSIKNNKIEKIFENDNPIYFLRFTNKNNIWIGTNKGAYFLNRNKKGKIINVDTLINKYKVSSIIDDFEGGKWVTTLNNGIFYKPKSDIKLLSGNLNNKDITNISTKNSKTFISTYSNEFFIINNNSVLSYKLPSNIFIIKSIIPINDSLLVIATSNRLFFLNSKNKLTEKNYSAIKNIIFSNNKIYIGTRFGFYQIEDDFKENKLIKGWINSSFNLNDSIILVAGKLGVYKVNSLNNKFEKINLTNKNQNIISINKYKDYLIFGTKGNGLIFKKNDSLKFITTNNGLSSNFINDIKIYNNQIWVATNKGINVLNLKNSTIDTPLIQSFFSTNGLLSNTVNTLSVNDTILYIGTNKGVSYINLNVFKPVKYKPNIQISNIKIDKIDTSILKNYTLRYKENNITIKYIGISYNFQKKIKYKYRFQKIDEDPHWVYTNNTKIDLVEINAGNYIFEVKSLINNIESNKSVIIKFKITPPYWNTILFKIIIYSIIFILITLFFYFLNLRNKKRNLEKLKSYKYQNQALINQINPHFIFNTLNSIQLYIYKNEKLKSAEYITKFSKLMRQVLDYSKIEFISISEEIDLIKNYIELERLRFDNKFNFKLNVDKKIMYFKIIPLITQPYIENAIWHGLMLKKNNGLLEVFIYEYSNNIIIAIDDNGIGRKKAKELSTSNTFKKSSYGQSIGVERINVFNKVHKSNASIEIKDIITNNKISGTRVLIKFPKII